MNPDERKLVQITEQNNTTLSAVFTALLIAVYAQTKESEFKEMSSRVVHECQ